MKGDAGDVIPIARPALGYEEMGAVEAVLLSGQLTQGPVVRRFERAFAEPRPGISNKHWRHRRRS